jgi:type II secretory pathway component PulF
MPRPSMFFSPRINTKHLAGLCRRLAISLESGIDVRKVWAREASRPGSLIARRRIELVREGVDRGDSLGEALAATGDYFPPLFRELAVVGEQTGHLSECFAQLADHYEGHIRLRRVFLSAIAWPMIQLVLALGVIGFLIWIMGVIGQFTGTTIDILGFGLVGNSGLAVYVSFLAVLGFVLFVVIRAMQRGLLWTAPLQIALVRVPMLGQAIQTLALARLAWSLHLTLDTGMNLRQALKLSLQSTHNAHFTRRQRTIDKSVAAGNSLYEAFAETDAFPIEFLDALHTGEQAGRLVETMKILSGQYQDQAQAAMRVLTIVAGSAVWAIIALFIILMILRIFSFYLGTINSALTG